jgi:hypothetical protein
MKFKVEKEAATGVALTALVAKIKAANKAQREFIQAHGYPTDIAVSTTRVAGGLIGVLFAEKPADWKLSFEANGKKYYYPMATRRSVRDIKKQIEGLPEVSVFEFNKAIAWDGFLCTYGLASRGDYWLLDVPELKEVKRPGFGDIEEITSLEYERLLAQTEDVLATSL